MNERQFIVQVLQNKWSEYLEEAGENSSALMIDLLAGLYIEERNKAEHYKKISEIVPQYKMVNS